MIAPAIPDNERERLEDLSSYSILDSLTDSDYDNLTAIASEICGTHIALVTLVDENRQWFKSHHGLDATETPREYAFCGHAINKPKEVFIIEDARKDNRFHDNPLVVGDPHVIFYAGVPLVSARGYPLGTLCVIDNKPKKLNKAQIKSLKALSVQVIKLFELRKYKLILEKAFKNLERKNEELENFATVAAHDIKSPLNNIASISQILKDEHGSKMEGEAMQLIDLIDEASKKLRSLVDGLLEYSRADELLKEQKTKVDLETLKNDMIKLLTRGEKCVITLKSDVSVIEVNKVAIDQIMLNLVSNAIKYNDKSVVEIEIGLFDGQFHYEGYVKDNGPGIPKESRKKIFKLFAVLGSKDRYGSMGTGIGLSTVKKLIQGLGGSINVKSEKGRGAKFIFTIPK